MVSIPFLVEESDECVGYWNSLEILCCQQQNTEDNDHIQGVNDATNTTDVSVGCNTHVAFLSFLSHLRTNYVATPAIHVHEFVWVQSQQIGG